MMDATTQAAQLRLADPSTAHGRNTRQLRLYGALFAMAAISFCLARLLDDRVAPVAMLFAIAGSATCGWSWLLSRALFRAPDDARPLWPLALVLALVAADAALLFSGERAAPLPRILANAATLISSALLLLAMIEPLKDIRRAMPRDEKRFRAMFAGGYAALLAIAVIAIDGAAPGSAAQQWSGTIKAACAAVALLGAAAALCYRSAHPLPLAQPERRRPAPADQGDLADRLLATIRDEGVFTSHQLRVADLARNLGAPEYKVTQCITGALGFRNFNQMVNHHRIASAKRMFADPACDRLPVLTIALDCGFGSIGPFNRAFKAETGLTPMHFRRNIR